MKPTSQSTFQIIGWVILIAMLGLSFFLLPVVMTMMHDGIPKERLSLWLPMYVLAIAFPVMAAYFYWVVLRKYMLGLSYWLIVAAATLGLVLLHRWTFGDRIFSNHREVVTFFIGARMAGTLGGMVVFGLVSRFIPSWMSIAQTPLGQSNESVRQKRQIGLKSIFVWTAGIAVIAAAFTNQDNFLLLKDEPFRIFLYQLFTFIGYAVFCFLLFLPVQAWLNNVTPKWLGKLSLLVVSAILPPSILWLICVFTIGAFIGEEMIVTLSFSAILFYLSAYAIIWNQAFRWTGLIAARSSEPKPVKQRGLFGTTFSLLRSGAKNLILAGTVVFLLLSIVWGAWHLIGGQGQDVSQINKKIHNLTASKDVDRDWIDAANDHLSEGITPENNVAVKLIKICNAYPVIKRDEAISRPAEFTLVVNDSDPSRHEEIARLGLTLEQLAEFPPLDANAWIAEREADFHERLLKRFPALKKHLASGFYSEYAEDFGSGYAASPSETQQDKPELTRDEKLAKFFMTTSIALLEYLNKTSWSADDCSLGADFVESHRWKTDQLVELSKETTFYAPVGRKYDGAIIHHDVFRRLLRQPLQLLTTTAYFDLGSGETESAVAICEALWRFAKLSPHSDRPSKEAVARDARRLAKAIVFSGAATESQMRRILDSWSESAQTGDSLKRVQELNRIFYLGRVYDRMTAPTANTTYSIERSPFFFLYQKFPGIVNWEVFLDRTEQLADQFDENEQAMFAGELTQQQFDNRLDELAGKTLSNGRVIALEHYNFFPAQQFSVFVHGPSSKGTLIAESSASYLGNQKRILSTLSRMDHRRHELARIAIGLEIYKTKNSAYPQRLQDLVPEILPAIPVDPLTLADFIYAPTKAEFKLYSTGRDGVDDGGDEKLDVIFTRPVKDIYEYLVGDE